MELLSCDVDGAHGRINQQCARSSVDRAVDFESKGRGFKSLRACQFFAKINNLEDLKLVGVRESLASQFYKKDRRAKVAS